MINQENSVYRYAQDTIESLTQQVEKLKAKKEKVGLNEKIFNEVMGRDLIGYLKDDDKLKLFNRRLPTFSYKELAEAITYHDRAHKKFANAIKIYAFSLREEDEKFPEKFETMIKYEPALLEDPVFSKLQDVYNNFISVVNTLENTITGTDIKTQSCKIQSYFEECMSDIYNRQMFSTVYNSINEGSNPIIQYAQSLIEEMPKMLEKDPFYQARQIKESDPRHKLMVEKIAKRRKEEGFP